MVSMMVYCWPSISAFQRRRSFKTVDRSWNIQIGGQIWSHYRHGFPPKSQSFFRHLLANPEREFLFETWKILRECFTNAHNSSEFSMILHNSPLPMHNWAENKRKRRFTRFAIGQQLETVDLKATFVLSTQVPSWFPWFPSHRRLPAFNTILVGVLKKCPSPCFPVEPSTSSDRHHVLRYGLGSTGVFFLFFLFFSPVQQHTTTIRLLTVQNNIMILQPSAKIINITTCTHLEKK